MKPRRPASNEEAVTSVMIEEGAPARPAEYPMQVSLNTVFGDRDLCAWQPVRGIVWVQTRHPKHAQRLARRSDSKLVAVGVAGGYLKTFEFARPMSWALRLMARYTGNEAVTNEALDGAVCPKANVSSPN